MMLRDPRNPDENYMVRVESTHEFHKSLRQILVLLKYHEAFIVVKGLHSWPATMEELLQDKEYFYNEHTCPTNFLDVELICENGDTDPHGIFEFVDAVWMTDEYLAAEEKGEKDEYLAQVFPQMGAQ